MYREYWIMCLARPGGSPKSAPSSQLLLHFHIFQLCFFFVTRKKIQIPLQYAQSERWRELSNDIWVWTFFFWGHSWANIHFYLLGWLARQRCLLLLCWCSHFAFLVGKMLSPPWDFLPCLLQCDSTFFFACTSCAVVDFGGRKVTFWLRLFRNMSGKLNFHVYTRATFPLPAASFPLSRTFVMTIFFLVCLVLVFFLSIAHIPSTLAAASCVCEVVSCWGNGNFPFEEVMNSIWWFELNFNMFFQMSVALVDASSQTWHAGQFNPLERMCECDTNRA